MSKPVASISVPSEMYDKWSNKLPEFKELVGDLSPMVVKMVVNGKLMTKQQLQQYVAKEGLTSRNKYLIIELD